jgi:tRNA G18 (ribose-2'-O)-methylase SpoU
VTDRRARQLAGPEEIEAALSAGEPVRLLLAASDPHDPRVRELCQRAHQAGIEVMPASRASLWRLGKTDPPSEILALVGRDPHAPMEQVMAERGAAWLLVGIAYPGNTGFAIRTAEVSGADGVFIESDFEHEGRREAVRAAMRADRFMPVFWMPALPLIGAAREAGRRILAIEDVGRRAPWEMDLGGPVLFVVGGERHGIPPEVLDACDDVIRIPMRGFIPSYNLQAAMAAVASERLRQLEGGSTGVRRAGS